MSQTTFVAEPGVPQFIVTRRFSAAPDLVFRAHIEPRLLERWLGPKTLSMTVDVLEPHHGGRWRYRHRDGHGNEYVFHGLYHGTPSAAGIVQTYEFDRQPGVIYLNTIHFDPAETGTVLRQNTVFQTVADRDGYIDGGAESGYGQSMERLENLLTTMMEQS